MGEIIMLLIIGGFGVIYYVETLGYGIPALEPNGGPAIFPQLVLVLLGIFLVIRIITILRTKSEDRKPFVFLNLFYGNRGVLLAGVIVYIVTMPYLGFNLGTFLFMTIICNVSCYMVYKTFGTVKSVVIREAGFAAMTLGIYLLFTEVLTVMLPIGFLGF